MLSKLIVAVCVVNMALSGYTSGWRNEKKVASVINERWSEPGSVQANSRALLGRGGSGGKKGGSSWGKGNSGGKGWKNDNGGKSGGNWGKSKDKGKGKGEGKGKGKNNWGKSKSKDRWNKSKDKGRKKGCDDDDVTGEPFWSTEGWWTTDDDPYSTDLPSEDPTPEPSTEPTTEPEEFTQTLSPSVGPSVEPSIEPTSSPSGNPTTEPTSSPTDEPTTEPSADPTELPTNSPSTEPTSEPSQEPTMEPTGLCPDAFAIEGGAFIPCECYTGDLLAGCPGDICFEENGTCNTVPSFVAVIDEQSDANLAQAAAVGEVTNTTSETNNGVLIAVLVGALVITTAIAFGVTLYCYKQRQKAYNGVAAMAATERDTATMMNGASGNIEWQTNVLALDEEAILPEGNGVRV